MLILQRCHINISLLLIALLMGGCAVSKPARFYTLSAVSDSNPVSATSSQERQLTIGIGPIKLASYLDRPQIVTRIDANRFEIAEFDRWGGMLRDDIAQTLSENMSQRLPTTQVLAHPWRGRASLDYQIQLEVLQFEGEAGKRVILVTHWQILSGDGSALLASLRSRVNEPIKGAGFGAMVAAQSRALGQLANEIAAALQQLSL